MSTEQKSGEKIESKIHKTLKRQFKKKCKAAGTSMAQTVRDLIQKFVKS